MERIVGVGKQDFEDIRIKNSFYIDKTYFIKECDMDHTAEKIRKDFKYEYAGKILLFEICETE